MGSDLPEIKIKLSEINKGVSLLNFLSENKIVPSKSEARRTIINNGLKINNVLVTDEKKNLQIIDFTDKVLKISFGKKKHFLVKII